MVYGLLISLIGQHNSLYLKYKYTSSYCTVGQAMLVVGYSLKKIK